MSLSRVALPDLEALLRAMESGRLAAPLNNASVIAAGFTRLAPELAPLSVLSLEAAVAVLRAVIEERTLRLPAKLELVWTGPEAAVAGSRDTAVVVREIFERAEQSVLVAGFRFDHGEELLRPLYERMRDRGLRTSIFMDIASRVGFDLDATAREAVDRFMIGNWPFGAPRPDLYFDPRTLDPRAAASLHAKCVVVDRRWSLITSANFTDRGQTRNIELGVLIDSADFAERLEAHWWALLSTGIVRKLVQE